MKRIFSIVLIISLVATLLPWNAMTVKAATEYQEGCFTYTISDDEVTITKYDTSMISGYVTIPSTLNGYPVTKIGDLVFYGDTSLTSISIPDSVRSIGEYSFYGCSELENVFITDIVAWCNIDFAGGESNPLSYAENLYLNGTLLTEITLPESVTSIGDYTFCGYTQLTRIDIPSSVISIGNQSFKECTGLISINIPNSIISIGEHALDGCVGLTSINIPSSVTNIGEYAFEGCDNLKSVYVTDIAAWCSIDFAGGESNPLSYAENLYLNEKLVTELSLPESVTSIGDYIFNGYDSLTSIVIPESTTSIGNYSFNGCTELASINIPSGVISIGDYSFCWCSNLKSLNILEGLTSIGTNAFRYSGLTSIELPNSLQEIQEYAFYGCNNLKDIYYNGTESEWKNIDCKDSLGSFTIHYLKVGVSGVEISLDIKSLYEEESFVLDAKVLPEEATNKNIFWKTSNPDIATVNDGVVTAIAPGTAIISVITEDGGKTASCKVEVLEHFSCETHEYSDWIKKDNNKHYRTCLVCGSVEEKEHMWDSGNITEKAFCETEGTKTYACAGCKGTKNESIEALGHEYPEEWVLEKAPTNSGDGIKSRYCMRCDLKVETTVIPKIECNHSNSGYKEIESSTCTTNGYWERRCYDCDAIIDSGEISCKHDESAWELAKEPTCTEDGLWQVRCNACDVVINSEIIPNHGHVYQYGFGETDREAGLLYMNLRCTYCKSVKSKRPISIHNHREHAFSLHVQEKASCTEKGWWKVFCTTCMNVGYTTGLLDSYEFGVNGHDFDYCIKQMPTCIEEGYWESRCKNCDFVGESGNIPALGHDEGYYNEIVSASCTKHGHWERKCNKCDMQITYGLIPITEHEYDYEIVEQSTCTSEGRCEIFCEDCGATIENINIKKIDHNYMEGWRNNNNGHWHECSICNTKKDEENHIYGSDVGNDACTICGWYYTVCSSPTGEHTGGIPTCIDRARCITCGQEYGELNSQNHVGDTEIRGYVAGDCGNAGYTGDTYCLDCETKIKNGKVIEATGNHAGGIATCKEKAVCSTCRKEYGELNNQNHTGKTEIRDYVVGDCGNIGYTGDTYCLDCETKIKNGKEIEATGNHIGGIATCKEKAVCSTCKKEYGELNNQNHTGDTEIRGYVAGDCGNVGYTGDTYCLDCETKIKNGKEIEATGNHIGGAATCNKKAECSVCGTLYGSTDENSHVSKWYVEKATLTNNGERVYKCSVCGKKESSAIIYRPNVISLSTTVYTYNGTKRTPSVTVRDIKGNKLVNGDDYTVTYNSSSRSAVGRYSVKIVFKGDYSGTKTLYFTIGPKNPSSVSAKLYGDDDVKVSWKKVSGASGYIVYYKKATSSKWSSKTTTGTSVKIANLSDGVKYDIKVVSYKTKSGYKCCNAGKTTSIYTLRKITGVKVTKSGTKVKVYWTNILGETGYQISQATSKTGTNIVSTYSTTKGKYKTISAKKNKTYYYKVRAYKTVNGKKIYGPWSNTIKYVR